MQDKNTASTKKGAALRRFFACLRHAFFAATAAQPSFAKSKKRTAGSVRPAVNFDLSACSKLTSLLLWLYDTVRICCFCDEAATARLQFKTDSVKLLRFRFHRTLSKNMRPRKGGAYSSKVKKERQVLCGLPLISICQLAQN